MNQPPETCIVITPPDGDATAQVLVRLPGHINPDDIAVDFRPDPWGSVWTPSGFFPKSVEVRHE